MEKRFEFGGNPVGRDETEFESGEAGIIKIEKQLPQTAKKATDSISNNEVLRSSFEGSSPEISPVNQIVELCENQIKRLIKDPGASIAEVEKAIFTLNLELVRVIQV